jgi:hypothetical protein
MCVTAIITARVLQDLDNGDRRRSAPLLLHILHALCDPLESICAT